MARVSLRSVKKSRGGGCGCGKRRTKGGVRKSVRVRGGRKSIRVRGGRKSIRVRGIGGFIRSGSNQRFRRVKLN
jgi:hypothetical protein